MKGLADKTEVFETLPVGRAVSMQVIPAVASQMVALVYNLADTYFVGMLNEPAQTAAITVAYPSFLLLTAVSNLFGVGGASALSAALGRKQREEAGKIAAVSFWGGLMCAVIFSILFYLFMKPVLLLCGAVPEAYEAARSYAFWTVAAGGPGTVLNALLANLVRGEGNAAAASTGVSLGGILNILLDPIFVLPRFLGMGAAGAGMATAISNLAAAAYFLIYILIRRGKGVVDIHPAALRHAGRYMKLILSAGLPSAVQYALTVMAVGAQSRFVSRYTTEAVAALGIVKKLDQLPLYFSIGVSNGLLPLLAYNYSAGNQERRREIFRLGCTVSFLFSMTCLAVYEVTAPGLLALFITDPVTVRYGAGFLRRMVTAMPAMSVCYPMIIQFQAMGKFRESLVCSVIRKGVLDIPLLFLMDGIFGLYGCMWVQPLVDTVSLAAAVFFYSRLRKKEGI